MITMPLAEARSTTRPRPVCMLPPMPFEVHFRGGQKLKPSFVPDSPEPTFHLQAKTEQEFLADTLQDWELISRTMLDSFFQVATPDEAFAFLASTGHFLWDAWSSQHPRYSDTLSWPAFLQWQELIRDITINGFLVAGNDESAPDGIRTIPDFPAARLSPERKRLIAAAPDSTLDLLNGCLPAFELVGTRNDKAPDGPSNRALVIETMTSIDTMLARLCIEEIVRT